MLMSLNKVRRRRSGSAVLYWELVVFVMVGVWLLSDGYSGLYTYPVAVAIFGATVLIAVMIVGVTSVFWVTVQAQAVVAHIRASWDRLRIQRPRSTSASHIPFPLVIVVMTMLAWALLPFNPYWYYTLLRVVCFVAFGILAIGALNARREHWFIVFNICAILYNPFASVHFPRAVWSVVNIVTIALLVLYTAQVRAATDDHVGCSPNTP